MNLETLLEKYKADHRIKSIAAGVLLPDPKKIYLRYLNGSAAAFVFSAVYDQPEHYPNSHLIILDSAEEAAYFHNTLESLINPIDLFYFPSSFKKKKDFSVLNSSHIMLRTEALTRIAGGSNRKIIVSYPDAVQEKVVVPKTLTGHIISIKTNDTLNIDELMERFVGYGFERTDFVYEPGQFAMRGGILDIYSFGNEKPYRVELFGNEVDSIRIFDPETQLSERKLLQVNIIPNIELNIDQSDKIPLPEFLPENTVVWVNDWSVLKERLLDQQEDLDLFLQRKESRQAAPPDEDGVQSDFNENDLVDTGTLLQLFEKRHLIEFGYASTLSSVDEQIAFNTKLQPAFNRQFDLLIKDLKGWEQKNFATFIFAENPKQLERLHSIFTDLNQQINFTPIPVAIHEGFIDEDLKVVCYTDHQVFQRYHKYKVKQAYNKSKALTIRALKELQPGDYVVHIDHGVGVYSGLQKMDIGGKYQEAVRILYKDNDILYVNINSLHKISRYTGKEGHVPKVNKIGSDAWQKLKEKTKTRVKQIAFDLIKLYAQRKAQPGFAHSPDNYMQTELEASFMYEDTPDQSKASADVKKDMESPHPMDRLVCGDVGFGKTEIAVRAAFKTCIDGRQAAILVPTTILAFQHFKTFSERLRDFPVKVDFVNRFRSAKEKKEILKNLEEGKVDIIIGTHGLLAKDVKFKELGLLVIDEEQKFGVGHKEKMKTLKTEVDCLTLTATPIPRTLQFSLMGARDLSIINTPPPNRQPIQTEVQVFNEDFIRDALYFETERGGQVFFIHNRIQGLAEMAALIRHLCPDLSVGFAHGQLEGHELEERIMDFIDKKYDILVCTNIVESGVDIPNVNTIIVNNAHQFGLSDLHQLRGRVGRSNKKAFCYLLAPPVSTLPSDSRKRLQTLEQHSDLGSGFQIAMRDLDIRGAGNMLGGEQSGFMVEIGFEMYQKILDEAIRELKRTSFREVFKEEISKEDDFVQDCTIDTDLEILIPDSYVENITERLTLYTRLDNAKDAIELEAFHKELEDRFGPVPSEVEDLFLTVKCRKTAVELGFERLVLKQETLRCYFVNNPDSPYFESSIFQGILDFIQHRINTGKLKQVGRNFMLIVEDVKTMQQLFTLLSRMKSSINAVA
ncbi:transcription-repair coupling factor [Pollutibacter soli]|uniref:transcription-repair coupling factor n=1 Tax=Pollutibacter soli TaxID=3034157 RepID=UPI003013FB83